MKKHPDIGDKVNWAGQSCEIEDATNTKSGSDLQCRGRCRIWPDRTGMLYWADDRTPGTAPTSRSCIG